jgi:hypothetical protein
MWVVKTKGESYYVHHVDCTVPWSTKETPNNSHTKGSIKVKNCLLVIDEENCATIQKLTSSDLLRLKKKNSVRVITHFGTELRSALHNIKHGDIKMFYGSCSTTYYVVDLFNKDDLPMLLLGWSKPHNAIRVLMPNEEYYKLYDSTTKDSINIDEEDWAELYED